MAEPAGTPGRYRVLAWGGAVVTGRAAVRLLRRGHRMPAALLAVRSASLAGGIANLIGISIMLARLYRKDKNVPV